MMQAAVAKASETSSNEQLILLHFMVQDLQCCLYVQDVERIIPLLDMQPVPGGPDYLIGLINFHGESIAGIDLGLRMGHANTQPYTIDTPVIFCSQEGGHIAFVVSEILEIQQCGSDAMQMHPEFKQGKQPYHAVVNTQGGLSLLLDIQGISEVPLGRVDDIDITPFFESEEDSGEVPES